MVVALSIPLLAAACGDGKQSQRFLRATSNFVRFTADQTVPGSSFAEAATLFDDTVRQQQAVRGYLDGLANSTDPFGKFFADAVCTGMQQLAQRPDAEGAASDEDWDAFLTDQVNILVPENLANVVSQKVDAFVTAAELGQISPSVARVYVQQCLLRPR